MQRKLNPDNTGTSQEILDAIYRLAYHDDERAEEIWEAPTAAELDAIYDHVLRRHGPGDYFWGAEGIVKPLLENKFIDPSDCAAIAEADCAAIAKAREESDLVFDFDTNPNGKRKWFEAFLRRPGCPQGETLLISRTKVTNSEGDLLGIFLVMTDEQRLFAEEAHLRNTEPTEEEVTDWLNYVRDYDRVFCGQFKLCGEANGKLVYKEFEAEDYGQIF